MSRCGFSWTRSDEIGSSKQGTPFPIFFLFSRGLSLVGFAIPAFVYFRANSGSEFDFAVIYHRFFLLRITKIESKIVETMLWTSKQASKKKKSFEINRVNAQEEERKICENEKWKEENRENPLRKAPELQKATFEAEAERRRRFSRNIVYYTCTGERSSSTRKNYILEVSKQRINQKVNK